MATFPASRYDPQGRTGFCNFLQGKPGSCESRDDRGHSKDCHPPFWIGFQLAHPHWNGFILTQLTSGLQKAEDVNCWRLGIGLVLCWVWTFIIPVKLKILLYSALETLTQYISMIKVFCALLWAKICRMKAFCSFGNENYKRTCRYFQFNINQ